MWEDLWAKTIKSFAKFPIYKTFLNSFNSALNFLIDIDNVSSHYNSGTPRH